MIMNRTFIGTVTQTLPPEYFPIGNPNNITIHPSDFVNIQKPYNIHVIVENDKIRIYDINSKLMAHGKKGKSSDQHTEIFDLHLFAGGRFTINKNNDFTFISYGSGRPIIGGERGKLQPTNKKLIDYPNIKCTCKIIQEADGTVRNNCLKHFEKRLFDYLNEKIRLNKERKAVLESSSGLGGFGSFKHIDEEENMLTTRYSIDKLDKIKLQIIQRKIKSQSTTNKIEK
jgi:hypothetical protein